MKAVAPHDRPREKLARLGAASLGDNELVAIVIGQGQARASALDLANALLTSIGGIESLGRARHRDLLQLRGIGSARAAQVLAAAELGRRIVTRGGRERVQVTSPRSVAEYLMPQYRERVGRAVRDRSTRYEAQGSADDDPLGRHTGRQHRASAGDFSRSGGGERGGHRAVPQSSVRRSGTEPGGPQADRTADRRWSADGDRRPRPHYSG